MTRVFYARADLDLIMSSPVALNSVFSVRIAAIALSVIAMALLFSTPFVDVLVIGGGPRWLAAYGVVVAIGLSAAAIAIAMTLLLFRLIGPSRTRLVAQILAAVVGAGFVIALQIAAILSNGTLSRFAARSPRRRRKAPASPTPAEGPREQNRQYAKHGLQLSEIEPLRCGPTLAAFHAGGFRRSVSEGDRSGSPDRAPGRAHVVHGDRHVKGTLAQIDRRDGEIRRRPAAPVKLVTVP